MTSKHSFNADTPTIVSNISLLGFRERSLSNQGCFPDILPINSMSLCENHRSGLLRGLRGFPKLTLKLFWKLCSHRSWVGRLLGSTLCRGAFHQLLCPQCSLSWCLRKQQAVHQTGPELLELKCPGQGHTWSLHSGLDSQFLSLSYSMEGYLHM